MLLHSRLGIFMQFQHIFLYFVFYFLFMHIIIIALEAFFKKKIYNLN